MFTKCCPFCPRALHHAAVAGIGIVTFHVAHDASELTSVHSTNHYIRQEHAPELEPTSGRDIPGFYYSVATTTTTTAAPTTLPPAITLDAPSNRPSAGNIVAWSEADRAWGQIPNCGYGV